MNSSTFLVLTVLLFSTKAIFLETLSPVLANWNVIGSSLRVRVGTTFLLSFLAISCFSCSTTCSWACRTVSSTFLLTIFFKSFSALVSCCFKLIVRTALALATELSLVAVFPAVTSFTVLLVSSAFPIRSSNTFEV